MWACSICSFCSICPLVKAEQGSVQLWRSLLPYLLYSCSIPALSAPILALSAPFRQAQDRVSADEPDTPEQPAAVALGRRYSENVPDGLVEPVGANRIDALEVAPVLVHTVQLGAVHVLGGGTFPDCLLEEGAGVGGRPLETLFGAGSCPGSGWSVSADTGTHERDRIRALMFVSRGWCLNQDLWDLRDGQDGWWEDGV